MPRREMVPCSVDFGLCLFEPHATCPETELAKSEIIVERASAIFAFSILFSTCKAPVPQLGALSINCCPPSFRCTRNRVVSFNLTRPPTLTRFHIKEALILSASQLSSTKKNEQEIKNISLSSTCSTLVTVVKPRQLWQIVKLMVHDSVAASEELRSIAGPESRQAPRSTWTVSRCPGDLHLSYAEQNTWSP